MQNCLYSRASYSCLTICSANVPFSFWTISCYWGLRAIYAFPSIYVTFAYGFPFLPLYLLPIFLWSELS
jgi:hypothetical protein